MEGAISHIRSALEGLGTKLDNLVSSSSMPHKLDVLDGGPNHPTPSHLYSKWNNPNFKVQAGTLEHLQQSFTSLSVPYRILLWPNIYKSLMSLGLDVARNLEQISLKGTPWFIKLQMDRHSKCLPTDAGLMSLRLESHPGEGSSPKVIFPSLTIRKITAYTDAYFRTFNVLNPILKHDAFMNDTATMLLHQGYSDEDPRSILAMLVFALGQVAIEGSTGRPISATNQVASGFRGGSTERPPGLEFFNEARRRLGFTAHSCTLENAQISFLVATFYEAHARHVEFWNAIADACKTILTVIRCHDFTWQSHRGDLICRLYWACLLSEDIYHLDLDLPPPWLHKLEDEVPMPFSHQTADNKPEPSYSEYQFLALIALRRVVARIHGIFHDCMFVHTRPDTSHPLISCSLNNEYGIFK